jgi:hypothetical protein
MKSMTLNNAGSLRRFLTLFNSLENPLTMLVKNRNNSKPTIETENKTVNQPGISEQRKAFTGNYFAGPHCIFDPRLFN